MEGHKPKTSQTAQIVLEVFKQKQKQTKSQGPKRHDYNKGMLYEFFTELLKMRKNSEYKAEQKMKQRKILLYCISS